MDRALDTLLTSGALRAAQMRLAAGAAATDLTCLTVGGVRQSGRFARDRRRLLLILRDGAVHAPAPRDMLEALRRHASTLVPMLDALDGPIPPALAQAIRAEGQGLANATRSLSRSWPAMRPARWLR